MCIRDRDNSLHMSTNQFISEGDISDGKARVDDFLTSAGDSKVSIFCCVVNLWPVLVAFAPENIQIN